jgi:glycerophosphoryl diester phosphodiesterase
VKPLVIAHRGASGAEFQNSRAAFRATAPLGADGVELDIHAARDGTLVVHHDPKVDGHSISALNAGDLGRLTLPNGETPPTLEEALGAIDRRLRVFVEVKTLGPEFDRRLFDTLDRGPNPAGYAVHSFDHRIVRRLAEERPGLPCGVLSSAYPVRPLTALEDAHATVLWQDVALIDADLVRVIHTAGRQVFAWTVNDSADIERCLDLGVDGICGNYPDRTRRAVELRSGSTGISRSGAGE